MLEAIRRVMGRLARQQEALCEIPWRLQVFSSAR